MNITQLRKKLAGPKYAALVTRVRELEAAGMSPDDLVAVIVAEFPKLLNDTWAAIIILGGSRVVPHLP